MTAFLVDEADLDLSPAELVRKQNTRFVRERARAWVTIGASQIVREAQRHGYTVDPIAWLKDPNFNMRQVADTLRESKVRLSEVVTSAMLAALGNVATTASAASQYQMTKAIYRELCDMKPSKKSEETYLALQRGDIPAAVGENEAAQESRASGVLTRIKNYDWARIWAVSRNAESDDQTGQLREYGQLIGEGMAYTEEIWALSCFFYAYVTSNLRPAYGLTGAGIIPARCIAGQNPADGGPTTAFGDLTLANAELALQAADYITDINGNYALVDPNALMCAGSRRVQARKIFGSPINPAGASTTAGQGPAGAIAGAFAINPLNGELTIHHSPIVNKVAAGLDGTNPPWAIGEAGKGWTFQDREPLEVMQEAENAGGSFDKRTKRIRAWRRFGAGVRFGEYWMRCN